MKIATVIVRVLLGLMFAVFGSNIFFHFIPMPPPQPSLATDFSKALMESHYMYVVGFLQVAGGLLLLIGRYVPLGLTLLGPVIVNILLFHIFLERTGLPMA
ncbi:MAG: DoxX family membrane protein, partial [Verrucomicrobiales bacterium]|nr:DoxX family membrane protein [Verrucomicrobiales bacterium]